MNHTINKDLAIKIQSISEEGFDFAYYEAEKNYQHGQNEIAIDWIYFAATLAWQAHPGFFYGHDTETILNRIGEELYKTIQQKQPSVNISLPIPASATTQKILHIMTSASEYGGHTRLVSRWIDNATINENQTHSIIITRQDENDKIPVWLIDSVTNSKGKCIIFPDNLSWLDKATQLRQLAIDWADLVVLHIHPNDPVPNIAFSAKEFNIPILFYNHADHVFTLGMSVATRILDIRKSGQHLTQNERGFNNSDLVPIPIADPASELEKENRAELRATARSILGIPQDKTVILTVGSEYKYKPALGYDFGQCVKEILKENNEILLYAVGIPNNGQWNELRDSTDKRFCPVGIISDKEKLHLYYMAADIYLEGFPFSSLTAMLEAGLFMLPIQRLDNPKAPILSGDDIAWENIISAANNETGYIQGLNSLIQLSNEERNSLGKNIRKSILAVHCGKEWFNHWVKPITQQLKKPCPQNIAIEHISSDNDRSENLSISLMQWGDKSLNTLLLASLRSCIIIHSNTRLKILFYIFLSGIVAKFDTIKNFIKYYLAFSVAVLMAILPLTSRKKLNQFLIRAGH